MRKAASLLTVLMLFCVLAFAQTRTVTGTVRDAQGNPVPFATITETGTKNAVQADANGNYTIKVNDNARLTITATGYANNTVSAGTAASVVLTRSTGELQEVVVTALGIRKKREEVGYATSKVTPDQITSSRNPNLASALTGKVAGMVVSNTSSGITQNPRIVLRGLRSMTQTNTALVVLDGVAVPANTINYLNPNDVESIDIMKGGQAATLFGSDGVNGAIVITTKKGGTKPEITASHTSNVEKVAYLPKFQDRFGSGSAYGADRDENFHPSENQQFGPRYDGSMRLLGRQLVDGSYQLLPYSNIKDVRMQLWNTGYTGQTDFSYRSGDANSNFFASYQNVNTTGVVYGDEYTRNALRLNAGRTVGKTNLSFDATYTWDKVDRTTSDFYFFAINAATWVPIGNYKDWRTNKFADPSGYYNDYYNNPWWQKDNNRSFGRNNYFNGNVKLSYKPVSSLELTARVGIANTQSTAKGTSNRYDYTTWSKTGAFSNNFNNSYDRLLTGTGRFVAKTDLTGGISESYSNGNRINGDLFGVYNKKFGDYSLAVTAGTNLQVRQSKSISAATSGIGQPDFFNLQNNSLNGLYTASDAEETIRKIGGYGEATFGYRGFLYLQGAFRRDYSSVFSAPDIGFNNPGYNTYGASLSFIATDAIPSLKNRILDNLKLRAAYNVNGNDNLGANSLELTYNYSTGFPYNGLIGTTESGRPVMQGLVPEVVKTFETGFEAGFVKNRYTLEFSYYKQKSEKQIIPIDVAPSTGYQQLLLNAADLDNWGIDVEAKAQVYRAKNWSVDFNVNYGMNKNKVNNIYLDQKSLIFQQDASFLFLNAEKGQMFPFLKTSAFMRDSMGHIVIDSADGWPLKATEFRDQGTTTPIHDLSVGTNIKWKNLTLVANAEYRGGHVVYHDIGSDMSFTGSGAQTTIYDRETFIWPNSVYKDYTGKYVTNTNVAVDNYTAIYAGYGDLGFSRGLQGTGEMFVSSGAFWKLRDVSLTFDFPQSIIGKVRAIRGLSITAWARNLKTWLPADNWYTDPELSNTSGNSQGINTTLNTPPVKQMGGTIRINF